MSVRVALADDHRLFREGLVRLLEGSGEINVVFQAGDGRSLLQGLDRHRVDVAVVDLNMPEMGGLEVTREIVARHADVRVLILTAHSEQESLFEALGGGALGYLMKDSAPEELAGAICTVARGSAVLGHGLAPQVFAGLKGKNDDAERFGLSGREYEILKHLCEALTVKQIAQALFLSPKTVQNHLTSIYTKLGVKGRAGAVKRAKEEELV